MSAVTTAVMFVGGAAIGISGAGCNRSLVVANATLLTIGLYLDETIAVNTGHGTGCGRQHQSQMQDREAQDDCSFCDV